MRSITRPASWSTWRTCLACSLVGSLLIALPDPDRRLFSLSETHGPGPLDFVGAIVLIAGWVVVDIQIWRRRQRLLAMPRAGRLLLVTAAVLGAVLVAWSVATDAGMWWLLGAGLLAGAQLVALVAAASRVRKIQS